MKLTPPIRMTLDRALAWDPGRRADGSHAEVESVCASISIERSALCKSGAPFVRHGAGRPRFEFDRGRLFIAAPISFRVGAPRLRRRVRRANCFARGLSVPTGDLTESTYCECLSHLLSLKQTLTGCQPMIPTIYSANLTLRRGPSSRPPPQGLVGWVLWLSAVGRSPIARG